MLQRFGSSVKIPLPPKPALPKWLKIKGPSFWRDCAGGSFSAKSEKLQHFQTNWSTQSACLRRKAAKRRPVRTPVAPFHTPCSRDRTKPEATEGVRPLPVYWRWVLTNAGPLWGSDNESGRLSGRIGPGESAKTCKTPLPGAGITAVGRLRVGPISVNTPGFLQAPPPTRAEDVGTAYPVNSAEQ